MSARKGMGKDIKNGTAEIVPKLNCRSRQLLVYDIAAIDQDLLSPYERNCCKGLGRLGSGRPATTIMASAETAIKILALAKASDNRRISPVASFFANRWG